MGEFSPFHWMIVIAVIVLFFGGKRIPEMMKGLGEGVKNFKEGMRDEPKPVQTSSANSPAGTTVTAANSTPEVK